jgi:hypothetical protein
MSDTALKHQILNCFALGRELSSAEVYSEITDIAEDKREVVDALSAMFAEKLVSRKQRTKKAAFIYHVALENVEPEPVVFIDNPILNEQYKPLTYKQIAMIVFGLVGIGYLMGVMS